jgi:hypothetical protein
MGGGQGPEALAPSPETPPPTPYGNGFEKQGSSSAFLPPTCSFCEGFFNSLPDALSGSQIYGLWSLAGEFVMGRQETLASGL